MTAKLLWVIAKLLVILIHTSYRHEHLYYAYGRRLDDLENILTSSEHVLYE